MSSLTTAFEKLGLDKSLAGTISATTAFSRAVDSFVAQDLSKTKTKSLVDDFERADTQVFTSTPGDWESIHYANDLIAHQPKFNFLFKVSFVGFPGGEFYRYVVQCDKPKIQLNHVDVNYYNFRTRVLTHVTLQPMTIILLDEIGNSINDLFTEYLAEVSEQASGGYGIDNGSGGSSSSLPYEKRGYSSGRKIIVQQIFANGLADNTFTFHNPRIETFDFSNLSMNDQSAGSELTLTFSYDALQCVTGNGDPIYTWGDTDIAMGGGTSNFGNNGGDTANLNITKAGQGTSANRSPLTKSTRRDSPQLPAALRDLVEPAFAGFQPFKKGTVSSADSTIDRSARETINTILSSNGFTSQ